MQAAIYRRYLLGLLTVILLFNYVDRLALGIVLEDIKADLNLTDTQLGFLSGIAFALFYSVMGIPIARWADRGNRVAIIALTVLLWSVAVALCGTAASFVQLLLIRVAVAVGEAGCIPAALSLIANYFSRAERPRANAIYGLGSALSLVVGFFLAGWLNQFFGWRITFVVLGAPGLVLAALAWFTLKEPRTARSPEVPAAAVAAAPLAQQPRLREVCRTLWQNKTFRLLLICQAVMFFFNNGIGLWLPTFYVRSHGLSSGQIGTSLAIAWGLGGLAGAYLGGAWASRYAANNERLQLQVVGIAIAAGGVLMGLVCWVPSTYLSIALLALVSVALSASYGPLFATIQTLVPENMRAVSLAIVYLFANLIGMGFGPLAAGTLSDAFGPWAGAESLRYALIVLAPGFVWGGWFAWRAARSVSHDLASLQADGESIGLDATVGIPAQVTR